MKIKGRVVNCSEVKVMDEVKNDVKKDEYHRSSLPDPDV